MIGTPITIKNFERNKTIVINDHTDPNNVIALQQFPTFESDVQPNNVARSGAHGEYHMPIYYSGMSIVLQGIIVANNEAGVWAIKKQFDDIKQLSKGGYPAPYEGADEFPPMYNNTLRLSFTTPNGESVFVDATPIKTVSYNRNLKERFRLDFQIILRANFPYLIQTSDSPVIVSGSLGSISKGFKLGTKLPLSLGNEYKTGVINVTVPNAGYAIVQLNGSADGTIINPKILNLTNDTFSQVNRPLAGTANYFKINGLYQTMTDQNGTDVSPYSNGEYVYLEAGLNQLIYLADQVVPN